MYIVDRPQKDDALMRCYYVGMTRAKKRLFVHTNSDCFDQLPVDQYLVDTHLYALPKELVLQLSHKDFFLNFFKNVKQEVLELRSGDPLVYEDFNLYNTAGKQVARLSLKMQKKLTEWKEKGYVVRSASVLFVVAWKPQKAPKNEPEIAVLLAELRLVSE